MPEQHVIGRGERVLIGLGGNLGAADVLLVRFCRAIELLEARLAERPARVSTLYWSDPVGPIPDQPRFLNGVIELALARDMPVVALLAEILAVEAELGRVRTVSQGPRTIDLDLLFAGDHVLSAAGPPALVVPHPHATERAFVLRPLAELLGPEWLVPGTARRLSDFLADPEMAEKAAALQPYTAAAEP